MAYSCFVHAFGGACLVNAIPHLVCGLIGKPFPSAFSSPIGVGLSSPVVNFLWGSANLALAYYLLNKLGKFSLNNTDHLAPAVVGFLSTGLMLSYWFGNL